VEKITSAGLICGNRLVELALPKQRITEVEMSLAKSGLIAIVNL